MEELLELAATPFRYEDPEKLDTALATLPLGELFEEAEALAASQPEYSEEDRLVIALLKWFKKDFQWVNAAPCAECGNKQTVGAGVAAEPTAEERRHGAGVVELYRCPECQSMTRFPRYNDVLRLLETRRGRCGEWCNVMTLFLRALGRDVRYVWNSEDHVWNEVWSATQQRWMHVDSCEAAFDKPLTYADGWGKKMAYVVGFSVGGARDITPRYVRRPDAALPRTRVPEAALQNALAAITAPLRTGMDPVDQVEWFERDEAEDRELQSIGHEHGDGMQPRQSGSAEWTQARGEAGRSTKD